MDQIVKPSQYARFFDQHNRHWTNTLEYNSIFIRMQQNYFNDLLKARGHVFLNEVYTALDFERTRDGQLVGWVMGSGDSYIDFGLYDSPVAHTDSSILLDFNVDGDILNRVFPV